MKTVGIASFKGGSGKSTLAINLATLASEGGERSVILDLDVQHSATQWRRMRPTDRPMPEVMPITVTKFADTLSALRRQNVAWVFVDSAPVNDPALFRSLSLTDYVMTPVRPAPLDLASALETLKAMAQRSVDYAALINGAPPAAKGEAAITRQCRSALTKQGHPVAPVSIGNRVGQAHALMGGLTVAEYQPDSKAAAEMRAVWHWLRAELR